MMVLYDMVEANWVEPIFSSLLDNARRAQALSTKKLENEVHFG